MLIAALSSIWLLLVTLHRLLLVTLRHLLVACQWLLVAHLLGLSEAHSWCLIVYSHSWNLVVSAHLRNLVVSPHRWHLIVTHRRCLVVSHRRNLKLSTTSTHKRTECINCRSQVHVRLSYWLWLVLRILLWRLSVTILHDWLLLLVLWHSTHYWSALNLLTIILIKLWYWRLKWHI